MNDASASRRTVLKYILPVLVTSILFNIPKFFESEEKVDPDFPDEPYIDVTDLRTNPGETWKK
jgi:hypothetical protein